MVYLAQKLSRNQDYSPLDRVVHRLAFSSRTIQLAAADIEQSLYGHLYRDIEINKPVFITSLPRAGTTLLLEILSRIPGFATHCYRDMPFVLAPLLWQKISGNFRKQSNLRERAHGDGMLVGYDSPEAFEEVLWHIFWSHKYKTNCISLWTGEEATTEFRDFMTGHMQKIIALRTSGQAGTTRYLSKNNANIARIDFIRRLIPDAMILVPFRHPIDHAASMLRQHKNFLDRHRNDVFSRKYMQDIGHFEFGHLHRRFSFAGSVTGNPDQINYWIAYWINAFEYIIMQRDHITLVSYENLCRDGTAAIELLADRLQLSSPVPDEIASMFKTPPTYRQDTKAYDDRLVERACELYRKLQSLSIT